MAAPIVSGITAMVWSVNPDMNAEDVKNIIQQTADITVTSRRKQDDGKYYMINASKAVEAALNYTSSDSAISVPLEDDDKNSSAYEKYLVAAENTTESGSWSEQLTINADMFIAYDGGQTKTKMTLNSNSNISNYVEDDLSQMKISGLTNMEIMGQEYAWSTEYENGIAQYHYTKPIEKSQTIEIDPTVFDFNSIAYEVILDEESEGKQIHFTVSGDKMTEIGIAALKQISGIDDLQYGDIDIIVILGDNENIEEIDMNFSY